MLRLAFFCSALTQTVLMHMIGSRAGHLQLKRSTAERHIRTTLPEHKITAGHRPISGHLSKVTAQNVTRSVLPSEQLIARVLWVGSRHAYTHYKHVESNC